VIATWRTREPVWWKWHWCHINTGS